MLTQEEISIIREQMASFPKTLLAKVDDLEIDTQDISEMLFDEDLWWIVFCGTYGCGKTQHITHAVYDYLKKVVLQYKADMLPVRIGKVYNMVHYIELDEFLDTVRRSYNDDEYKQLVTRIRNIPILVLDEVREEKQFSQDEIRNMELLVNHRHKNGLLTVLITNANNFKFLPSMIKSRLNENSYVKLFENIDRRKQTNKGV